MNRPDPRFRDLSPNEVELVRLLLDGQRPPLACRAALDFDLEQVALGNAAAALNDDYSSPSLSEHLQ